MKKWGVKNRKAGQWSRCGNIQFSLLSWELQREQKMTSLQRKKLLARQREETEVWENAIIGASCFKVRHAQKSSSGFFFLPNVKKQAQSMQGSAEREWVSAQPVSLVRNWIKWYHFDNTFSCDCRAREKMVDISSEGVVDGSTKANVVLD